MADGTASSDYNEDMEGRKYKLNTDSQARYNEILARASETPTGSLLYDRDVVNYVNSNKPLINFNDLYEEEIKKAERKL